jgi:hypothetical protein
MQALLGEGSKVNHEVTLSMGGRLLVKTNWVAAEVKCENPLEEIAAFPPGSYQYKCFTSLAGSSVVTDMLNCNNQVGAAAPIPPPPPPPPSPPAI